MVMAAQRGAGWDCAYVDTPGRPCRMFHAFYPPRHGAHLIADSIGLDRRGVPAPMLSEPRKYIGLPSVIFVVGSAVSVATGRGQYHHGTGWQNPFAIMFGVYFVWNFYHFSMQNYGVMRLCGAERWEKALAFVVTAVGIKVMPLAVSVNHWVVDIGLSARVCRYRRGFIAGLLLIAPVAFL